MVGKNCTKTSLQVARPRSFSWLLTSAAGLCLAGLVGYGLFSELTQSVEAMNGAGESAVAVASNVLPVDAPAVSVARAKELETDASNAAAAVSTLIFKDWNYTQASSSPFNFGDSSNEGTNPLFAFDFNQPNQSNALTSLFGNGGASTPFALSNSSNTPATTSGGGGGTTTVMTTGVPSGTGISIDPTVSIPGLNGLTLSFTINISFNFGALGLGTGIANNHFGLNGISITITIQVISPTS
jgi:hypothetical protein